MEYSKHIGFPSIELIMSFFIFSVSLLLITPGCDELDTRQDCEKHNTGNLEIRNNSSHSSHDVYVDGNKIATLTAGTSVKRDLKAGQHRVEHYYSGTPQKACSHADVTVQKCSNQILYCDADK